MNSRAILHWLGCSLGILFAVPYGMAEQPPFGDLQIVSRGRPVACSSDTAFGFFLFASDNGPQVAAMPRNNRCVASLSLGEEVLLRLPLAPASGRRIVHCTVTKTDTQPANVEVSFSLDGKEHWQKLEASSERTFQETAPPDKACVFQLAVRAANASGEVGIEVRDLRLESATGDVRFSVKPGDPLSCPPLELPPMRESIQQAMIEWDWQMQDGIGVERASGSYAQGVENTLRRGDLLLRDLERSGTPLGKLAEEWQAVRRDYERQQAASPKPSDRDWQPLWLRAHRVRRAMALKNPAMPQVPLLLVKQAPSMFSHQLTQYQGSCARPGGGLFVLDQPGRSMSCRPLAAGLPPRGNYQLPDVSFDGRSILFSYCRAETVPPNRDACLDRYHHLYQIDADGGRLRQLTDGPFDDIAPRFLPDGKILFLSTRRGGYHRCGRGPCPAHTLALCEADGSSPRVISFHETHEWDPAVLNDGRVIYTRWDYVDRHAVHYQQLWTVRPDGSDARIFYGNNTLNPVGVWEARPVPGSTKAIATAAAHHSMTAGSIVLLDTRRGIDGLEPIERLTPDALFPESEAPVARRGPGTWHAPAGLTAAPKHPVEQQRWPGHCYRTPWPLSKDYFLVAYSCDALIGEPDANAANMFGVYLADRFGNKELLYRDLNLSSLWPMPIAPRIKPPELPSAIDAAQRREGTFLLQNVYESWPSLPAEKIARLRIVQVLPKSTPHANDPPVGLANASPGKQVLGTVPVEADGSAFFQAPAGVPLAFQALDDRGRAVQVMRSLAYLQPGENASCVGCHEPRHTAPAGRQTPLALSREPSAIVPGPDGSRPFSYPILVQPVLDRHCVACHKADKPEGGVILTGEPEGRFTRSYLALAPRVSYSDWAGRPGDFRKVNSEPMSAPDFFGARGSRLMRLLDQGHYDVRLSREDDERLSTWIDANALFYGTFDRKDQARQQRGERISGPALE